MNLTDATDGPIVVVAICGSLRPGSFTRRALAIALQGAAEAGAVTRLIDLQDYRLAFCGSADGPADLDDVVRLRRDVGQAHGILLGTPEYHGGYSGVLKNALDLMGFAEIEGKMIGLVGCSGGAMGASDALSGLRAIGRALHAWVIPEQVCIPEAYKSFGESGQLNDRALETRLKDVGFKVARYAHLHSTAHRTSLAGAPG